MIEPSTEISTNSGIRTSTPKKIELAEQEDALVEPLLGIQCCLIYIHIHKNDKFPFEISLYERSYYLEGPCKTLGWNKEMCLRKSEVGRFASFMQAGDPCFLKDDGKRVSKF